MDKDKILCDYIGRECLSYCKIIICLGYIFWTFYFWNKFLNNFEFLGVKLGFFLANQGSIYFFFILIILYILKKVSKLDEKYSAKRILMELQSLIYLFRNIFYNIFWFSLMDKKSSSTKIFYIAKTILILFKWNFNYVDFISAVTFVALTGTISYLGFDGSAYIMGFYWWFCTFDIAYCSLFEKIWKISSIRVY